jgi:hypothetical protein
MIGKVKSPRSALGRARAPPWKLRSINWTIPPVWPIRSLNVIDIRVFDQRSYPILENSIKQHPMGRVHS